MPDEGLDFLFLYNLPSESLVTQTFCKQQTMPNGMNALHMGLLTLV